MKKLLFLLVALFASSCSSVDNTEQYACPEILIPRETTRLYQNNGMADDFQINLIGSSGFCYTEANRRYAVINPVFLIRRLEDSSTTNVDADFYVKTSAGGEDYVGTRTYSQSLNIPVSVKEHVVEGRKTTTRIPLPPYGDFKIYLGMALSNNAAQKSKKMFDINYKYLSQNDILSQPEKEIETIYLKAGADEKIIFSEKENKPVVVNKNCKTNSCQN